MFNIHARSNTIPQVFPYTKQNILIKSVTYVTETKLNKTQRERTLYKVVSINHFMKRWSTVLWK